RSWSRCESQCAARTKGGPDPAVAKAMRVPSRLPQKRTCCELADMPGPELPSRPDISATPAERTGKFRPRMDQGGHLKLNTARSKSPTAACVARIAGSSYPTRVLVSTHESSQVKGRLVAALMSMPGASSRTSQERNVWILAGDGPRDTAGLSNKCH